MDLHDNHFTVHALDASFVDGLDDGGFVQQLMEMEKKHMKPEDAQAASVEAAEPQEQETELQDSAEVQMNENQVEEATGDEH